MFSEVATLQECGDDGTQENREITFAEMVAMIRRFRAAVRRLNQAIEQVELASFDGWAMQPEDGGIPPVPWESIRRQELGAVRAAVQSVAGEVAAIVQTIGRWW